MNIPSYELARIEDECRAKGVYDQYRDLVDLGNNPRFAAMLALQEPAGTRNTDRAFCQGQQRKMENMTPWLRKELQKRAKKAGIDTSGKYYIGGLAERGKGPTDPAAWVSSSEDVLTICKQKNLGCDGVIRRDATQKEPTPSKPLADDIVAGIARKMLRNDPALRERVQKNKHARHELRERIIEKHSRKKHKPSRLAKSC